MGHENIKAIRYCKIAKNNILNAILKQCTTGSSPNDVKYVFSAQIKCKLNQLKTNPENKDFI